MRVNAKMLAAARQEEVDIVSHLEAAQTLLKIIKKVLTEDLESAILRSELEENINTPDFAVTQANLLGYRKGLRYALSLIETKETK